MIHQHFKLIDVYNAIDNIILGESFYFDEAANKAKIASLKSPKATRAAKKSSKETLNFLRQGWKKAGAYIKFNWLSRNRGEDIRAIADKYGFAIDLKKKIYDMSVSEKQTVEIIKVFVPRRGYPHPGRTHRRIDPAGDKAAF